MLILKLLVAVSALFAIGALARLHLRLSALGSTPMLARAQGRVAPAVVYAFTTGMLPWAKESAAKHLPTYVAGITYHFGIAVSLFVLGTQYASYELPRVVMILSVGALAVAAACGLGLLIKRATVPYMRAISTFDDYLASILVTLTLCASITSLLVDASIVLFLTWIALFAYIPFGKIRHCWFFFVSRFQFGRFYGYRGVIAPSKIGETSHE